MKKIILFLLIILFPTFVGAVSIISYNESLNYVNNRIKSFTKNNVYLVSDNSNYKCEITSGAIGCAQKSGFISSGYLNYDEYDVIGGINSYLNKGSSYYTMTTKSSTPEDKVTLVVGLSVNANGWADDVVSAKNGGTRITQYVKESTKIAGSGTISNPWTFMGYDESWLVDPTLTFSVEGDPEGENEWFRSNIVVKLFTSMPKGAVTEFKYCLTTASSCVPSIDITDTSKDITIDTESASNKICATLTTIIGKNVSGCSSDVEYYASSYKIDKTNPSCVVSASGNNFAIKNTSDTLSGINTSAYSWNSQNGPFSSITTTPATDAMEYSAYVKDNAGNVGTCSKMTCSAWGSTITQSTTGTCNNSITSTTKTSNCTALYTCSKSATYSCGNGGSGTPTSSSPYCYSSTLSTTTSTFTGYTYQDNIGWDSGYPRKDSRKCPSAKGTYNKTRATCGKCGTYYNVFCKGNYLYHNHCTCKQVPNYSNVTTYYCSSGTKISNSQCRFDATVSCESNYTVNGNLCERYNQTSCTSGYTPAFTSNQYNYATRTCEN